MIDGIIKAEHINGYGNILGTVLLNPNDVVSVVPGTAAASTSWSEYYSVFQMRDGRKFHVKLSVKEAETAWVEALGGHRD